MNERTRLPFLLLLACVAVALFLAVPFAFADDSGDQETQAADYSAVLSEIERLIGELPDKAAIGELSDKLDVLKPFDDSGSFEDVSTLIGGATSVNLFTLVVELMQLGAVLALVFVVALRTNR